MSVSEATLDQLEDQIRSKLESVTGFGSLEARQLKMTRIFKKHDKDKSGVLNLEEFALAMSALNFTGVATQLEKLFDRYDEEDNGTVSYEEFINRVLGINPNPDGRCPQSFTDRAGSCSNYCSRRSQRHSYHWSHLQNHG